MKNNRKVIVFVITLFLFPFTKASAQTITDLGLKKDIAAINAFRNRLPAEKLYLEFDKPYYFTGDTMRFKAYVLNADFLTPSTRSGLLYVELDDANNKSVKRIMLPLAAGISWGDMVINETELPQSSYTLRAYTNWMRNFGEDDVFKKSFFLAPATAGSLLVSTGFKMVKQDDKDQLQASLQFTTIDKLPVVAQNFQLKAIQDRKTLYNGKAITGADGELTMQFSVPDQTNKNGIYILATPITKDGKLEEDNTLTIPVTINRPENTALEFMPEGGNLVAGISGRIGFKATTESGHGAKMSGAIYNSKQQQVAIFTAGHGGAGAFELTPDDGESYTAKLSLPGNISKSYPLPQVKNAGTTLKVNAKGKDSVELIVNASPDLLTGAKGPAIYYLIGQARGVICYATVVKFDKNAMVKKSVATELFPAGAARFTLLGVDKQVLNERIFYVSHLDDLQLNIMPDKQTYGPRDSVVLALNATDRNGKPIQGSFALSVTDNAQIKADRLGGNMVNYLLLSSNIKEPVEEPGYYFTGDLTEKMKLLDELLLTQKSTEYNWKTVLDSAKAQAIYPAEQEFVVSGKVTNMLNKPVEGAKVTLLSQSPFLVTDTATDKNGRFEFHGMMSVDTAVFKLQATNKKGKEASYGIVMDEFKPPVFKQNTPPQQPWYVNTDTIILKQTNERIARQKAEDNNTGTGHRLNEVVIKDKKVIKGSRNLNGPGEADQVLDEKDMLKEGKMTLGDLLLKDVKGFKFNGLWHPRPDTRGIPAFYMLNEKLIHFVIDGIALDQLAPGSNMPAVGSNERLLFIKSYLDYYTAEDITGIEVIFNPKYNANYGTRFINGAGENIGAASGDSPHAYIEITTRSGQGPFMKSARGTYLYKPIPFSLPKPVYRPKYTIKNRSMAMGTDLRSTIYWEPNLSPDKAGRARVLFYSADKSTTYTIQVNGISATGEPGSQQKTINITAKQ